jgi:hypothetical protein
MLFDHRQIAFDASGIRPCVVSSITNDGGLGAITANEPY